MAIVSRLIQRFTKHPHPYWFVAQWVVLAYCGLADARCKILPFIYEATAEICFLHSNCIGAWVMLFKGGAKIQQVVKNRGIRFRSPHWWILFMRLRFISSFTQKFQWAPPGYFLAVGREIARRKQTSNQALDHHSYVIKRCQLVHIGLAVSFIAIGCNDAIDRHCLTLYSNNNW